MMKKLVSMLKEALSDWSEDNAPRFGAALSYYTIFSLAPLLLIAIGIAGLVFGAEAGRNALGLGVVPFPGGPDFAVHRVVDGVEALRTVEQQARHPWMGWVLRDAQGAEVGHGCLRFF